MAKQQFLPRLESVRGIAALTVVSHHVSGQFSEATATGFDAISLQTLRLFSNGTGAVVAFFVLSGFVLARSLEANPDPIRYFRNRFFRLFPTAVAVVALFSVLHLLFGVYVGYEGDFSPINVLLNMLMIRTDINAVMWSLKVECFATPLIIFCAWLVRRNEAPWLWAIVAALFGLSFVGQYRDALGDASNLSPLYAFVVGVLANHHGKRAVDISSTLALAITLLSIVAFCYCGTRNQSGIVLAIECAAAASVVVIVAWHSLMIFNLLDFSVVRLYGRISYSFYLLHMLGILVANRIAGGVGLSDISPTVSQVITTVAAVAIATPAAYLSWRFIEIPFIAFGRKLNNSKDVIAGDRRWEPAKRGASTTLRRPGKS